MMLTMFGLIFMTLFSHIKASDFDAVELGQVDSVDFSQVAELHKVLAQQLSLINNKLDLMNLQLRQEVASVKDEFQQQVNSLEERMFNMQSDLRQVKTQPRLNATPVAFSAFSVAQEDYPSGSKIIFDGITYASGAEYDPETSVFTCEVAGVYLFTVTLGNYLESGANGFVAEMYKNTQRIARMTGREDSGDSVYHQATNTVIIDLQPGDTLYVNSVEQTSAIIGIARSTFSGFLIYDL